MLLIAWNKQSISSPTKQICESGVGQSVGVDGKIRGRSYFVPIPKSQQLACGLSLGLLLLEYRFCLFDTYATNISLRSVLQGISKGVVVESLLSSMVRGGKAPDFVLCIGDDRSDEDMFESIVCPGNNSVKLPATSEVFACTVGKKPSMAKYYLDDTVDVIKMLQGLANAPSQQRPWPPAQLRVTFESTA
jgi:hypothetical protein